MTRTDRPPGGPLTLRTVPKTVTAQDGSEPAEQGGAARPAIGSTRHPARRRRPSRPPCRGPIRCGQRLPYEPGVTPRPRAGLILPERLAEYLTESMGEPRNANGVRVDGASRPVDRDLDSTWPGTRTVDILGWLMAIPRSRRMREIKAVPDWAALLRARHAQLTPFPDAIRAVLGPHRFPTGGTARASVDSATPVSARPPEGRPARPRSNATPSLSGASHGRGPRRRGGQLDRLLQSFRR
jgi:hypothetical protein